MLNHFEPPPDDDPRLPPYLQRAVEAVLHNTVERGCSCPEVDVQVQDVIEPDTGRRGHRIIVHHSPICHLAAYGESSN